MRYLVHDVAETIAFYSGHLGFAVDRDGAPAFAALRRDDLRLLVNAVGGPGGAPSRRARGSVGADSGFGGGAG